jgi:hypothetical protein
MIEMVLEKMNDDTEASIHLSLRIIYNLFLAFEESSQDQELAKQLYSLVVPISLPVLLEAFTKEEMGAKGRAHTLVLFYLMVRGIAWADGMDNELVHNCLDETFNNWMALFLQIL